MSDVFQQKDPSFLSIRLWENHNTSLVAGFTTKNGGFSHSPFNTLNLGMHVNDCHEVVLSTHLQLSNKVGFPLTQWVADEQVHDTYIHSVGNDDKGKGAKTYNTSIKDVDGLITQKTEILCTAFFAD